MSKFKGGQCPPGPPDKNIPDWANIGGVALYRIRLLWMPAASICLAGGSRLSRGGPYNHLRRSVTFAGHIARNTVGLLYGKPFEDIDLGL